MNLLMLSSNRSAAPLKGTQPEEPMLPRVANTLEGLIGDNPFTECVGFVSRSSAIGGYRYRNENGISALSNEDNISQIDSHIDVKDDVGFVIIPSERVPENWMEAPDMRSLRSLDRNFVFPGEKIQILACLSSYKHDSEIITPFKVAAVMNKNGIGKGLEKQNGSYLEESIPDSQGASSNECDGEQSVSGKGNINSGIDVPTGETLLRRESHKRRTEELLQRFENSYYFVRVAGSEESLWSKREDQGASMESSVNSEKDEIERSLDAGITSRKNASVLTERGQVDASTSGGLARGAVECCSLPNGDLAVLLQVNVGVQFLKDPILEILQFEKHQPIKETLEYQDPIYLKQDHCDQLLNWLCPLDNYIPPPESPLYAPLVTPGSSFRSNSSRSVVASSQNSSSGHSRSFSLSSLTPNTSPLRAVTTSDERTVFGPEGQTSLSPEKFVGSWKIKNDEQLSFRGVPLEPERFSVQCGLEGIFRPGRRWARKIKLIHPVQIDSFSVDCNTEDIICILVKNVSPAEVPDIVVFIDSVTLVLEEASKGGQPLSIPVSCVEPGNNSVLPNLALRRGEEHSFIVKPACTLLTQAKCQKSTSRQTSHSSDIGASQWFNTNTDVKENGPPTNHYAVVVSCRCNYTGSKLIFKQPTRWRPRISRDLMVSVASDMSVQALESDRTPLPFQVMTLQASNKTSESLTLTVLAPDNRSARNRSALAGERTASEPDVLPNGDEGCTHLWLQSSVPFGCVAPQSTATIKLEVLPLTNGIITLDSLQIEVKEKGLTYVPEQSLKIHATSSIAAGIL